MRHLLNRLCIRLNHLPIWRLRMDVWGNRMGATSADRALYLFLNKLGLMGKGDLRLFEALLQPGMTVVDIGANIGCYSLKLARAVGPSGTVYSFEPNPVLAAQLRDNCLRNHAGNVHVQEVALGASLGTARLLVSAFNSGDNYLAAAGRGLDRSGVDVELDTFDRRLGDVAPDFVKIDVQGAEMQVLHGMEDSLRRLPGMLIYFEVHARGLLEAGTQPGELLHFFIARGFELHQDEGGSWRRLANVDEFAERCARRPGSYTNLLAARPANPHLSRLPGRADA